MPRHITDNCVSCDPYTVTTAGAYLYAEIKINHKNTNICTSLIIVRLVTTTPLLLQEATLLWQAWDEVVHAVLSGARSFEWRTPFQVVYAVSSGAVCIRLCKLPCTVMLACIHTRTWICTCAAWITVQRAGTQWRGCMRIFIFDAESLITRHHGVDVGAFPSTDAHYTHLWMLHP